jgi:hypothetical protein
MFKIYTLLNVQRGLVIHYSYNNTHRDYILYYNTGADPLKLEKNMIFLA